MEDTATILKRADDANADGAPVSGGNESATAATTSAPINATTNSSQAATASGMERSLPSEEAGKEEEKPIARDPQKEAEREVLRILGFQDPEATHATISLSRGNFVITTQAALTSIINTNADNVRNNENTMARVAGALAFHNPQQQANFLAAMAAVDAAKQRGEIVELGNAGVTHVGREDSAQLAVANTGAERQKSGPAPASPAMA